MSERRSSGDPPKPPATPAGDGASSPDADAGALGGPALARAMLDAARARRRAGPAGAGRAKGAGDAAAGRRRGGRGGAWSGPGPDPRDPQLFGTLLAQLVRDRGWQRPAAEASLFGAWERVVGPEVAQHCRPVKLEDGELTLEASSTAWATQLRLLAGSLLRQIAAAVGHNVVTRLRIHGPAAPSWSRGPRRIRGRGPRDTYG